MRNAFIISALLFCGCAASHRQAWEPVIPQSTILDEVLVKPEYAKAVKEAESDLPGDRWQVGPKGRWNVSRSSREWDVTSNMIADITPRLQKMSTVQLVRSLKVVTVPDGFLTNEFMGVQAHVYELGNSVITKELRSRPKSDLEALSKLADDRVAVWTGPNGAYVTLTDYVLYDLFDTNMFSM